MLKKMLFLTPQLPYPPYSGGTIKSWRLVEHLSKKWDLTLACFFKGEDESNAKEFEAKVKLAEFYHEHIDVPRTPGNLVKSLSRQIPLNLYRNQSEGFSAWIEKNENQYEVIFVDHYEMFQYVSADFKGAVVLHEHNAEYIMWERFAKIEPSILKRFALRTQSYLIKKYEKKICDRSQTILAAPNDIDELVAIGADRNKFYETYHLGEEDMLRLPDLKIRKTTNALLYVGTLSWEANVHGLLWFLKEGWSKLKLKHTDLKFYIIGKNPDQRLIDQVESMNDPAISFEGFVEDLDPYFRKSRVFVSPLLFGSGIKVKVMNALYRGIPTVTTSVGAEGLAAENNQHISIENDIEGFVGAVSQLLIDDNKWQTYATKSRALAIEKYTWKAVLDIVDESIDMALKVVS